MTKFCLLVDPGLITYATFGDDRLKGLGVARVEFPISPLTSVIALTNPEKRRRVKVFDAQFRTYGEKKPLEGS